MTGYKLEVELLRSSVDENPVRLNQRAVDKGIVDTEQFVLNHTSDTNWCIHDRDSVAFVLANPPIIVFEIATDALLVRCDLSIPRNHVCYLRDRSVSTLSTI